MVGDPAIPRGRRARHRGGAGGRVDQSVRAPGNEGLGSVVPDLRITNDRDLLTVEESEVESVGPESDVTESLTVRGAAAWADKILGRHKSGGTSHIATLAAEASMS